MTDVRDPLVQTLFAEAQQELDGKELTARVMARTRSLTILWLAAGVSAAIILLAGAWLFFAIPLLEFAVLIANALTSTLVDLGDGWLALVFLPVNNVASLLVLVVKAMRVFQKKVMAG